jgi:ribosome maturation protein SDO1
MQLPLSQQRHSNVATVRVSRNGVKLEIACYKNKVINYRGGVETRLDEVLQIDRVFTNVAKGSYASLKDIHTCLGSDYDERKALQYILDHGQLQVAHHERTVEVDDMFKDISTIISQKCVDKFTGRPLAPQVIEQTLRQMGVAIRLDQPVKKQALAFIHQLIDSALIPIARARMKVRCSFSSEENQKRIEQWCHDNQCELDQPQQQPDPAQPWTLLVSLDPGLFRELDAEVKKLEGAGNTMHVVEHAVTRSTTGTAAELESAVQAMDLQHPPTSSDTRRKELSDGSGSGKPHNPTERAHGEPPETKKKKASKAPKPHDDKDDDHRARHRGPHDLQEELESIAKLTGPKVVAEAIHDASDSEDDKRSKKKHKKPASSQPDAGEVRRNNTAEGNDDSENDESTRKGKRRKR